MTVEVSNMYQVKKTLYFPHKKTKKGRKEHALFWQSKKRQKNARAKTARTFFAPFFRLPLARFFCAGFLAHFVV